MKTIPTTTIKKLLKEAEDREKYKTYLTRLLALKEEKENQTNLGK